MVWVGEAAAAVAVAAGSEGGSDDAGGTAGADERRFAAGRLDLGALRNIGACGVFAWITSAPRSAKSMTGRLLTSLAVSSVTISDQFMEGAANNGA